MFNPENSNPDSAEEGKTPEKILSNRKENNSEAEVESDSRRFTRLERRMFADRLDEIVPPEDRRLVEKFINKEKITPAEARRLNDIKECWWGNQKIDDIPCKNKEYQKDFLERNYRFEEPSFPIREGFEAGSESKNKTTIEAGLKKSAEWLRQLGLPVDDECRLVMDEYAESGFDFAEIAKDKEAVRNAEEDFAQKKLRQGGAEKSYTLGEQMERFSTVLMLRFLKELAEKNREKKPLAVVRTARFDDIFNHIDYAIFDTATGAIVGAVDVTIANANNAVYNKKEERIDGMNVGGRGELKYGLDVGKDDPNGNIVLKSRKDVPVFLLNLPKEDLRQHLNKVDYDGQSMSGLENRIINSFLGSMVGQIRTFEDAEWAKENSGSFAKIRALYDRRMINI
jgi:hypothetical protein